ncbi:MAG: hypothetical protein GX857_00745 [Bacteroidales bacterium]|jgi:membrane protease subunit (stomatin/prohibitin family)|nr:hypothetical protein [Bacteroidales bacterium]
MKTFKNFNLNAFKRSVELVEWMVHAPRCTLWRYPKSFACLENGTRLRVREGQKAVLVSNGKLADVFKPGEYDLTAKNMPILLGLNAQRLNFKGSNKIDVYFINTKRFVNIPWATSTPILIDDSNFGPIYISFSGTYSFHVEDNPCVYIGSVAGNDRNFTTDGISDKLRRFVVSKLTEYITELSIGVYELKTELKEFSNDFTYAMKEDFTDYGIELTDFVIEKVTLPKAVEAALSKELNKRIVGNNEAYKKINFDDMFKGATVN